MKKSKLRKWLVDHEMLEDGFLAISGDNIPTEISIKGERWELSFEGRTEEIADRGVGLGSLLKLLRDKYVVFGRE